MESDLAPWADEVTTLLLGLVMLSHQRYLGQPLLEGFEKVAEDQRAAMVWEAPFALVVQDDSSEGCIEYVNRAASDVLGGDYLDLFGTPLLQSVDPAQSQQVGCGLLLHSYLILYMCWMTSLLDTITGAFNLPSVP